MYMAETYIVYIVKKVTNFPLSAGMSLTNSPWPGIIQIFPALESLTSRLGRGTSLTFFTVYVPIAGVLTAPSRGRGRVSWPSQRVSCLCGSGTCTAETTLSWAAPRPAAQPQSSSPASPTPATGPSWLRVSFYSRLHWYRTAASIGYGAAASIGTEL